MKNISEVKKKKEVKNISELDNRNWIEKLNVGDFVWFFGHQKTKDLIRVKGIKRTYIVTNNDAMLDKKTGKAVNASVWNEERIEEASKVDVKRYFETKEKSDITEFIGKVDFNSFSLSSLVEIKEFILMVEKEKS